MKTIVLSCLAVLLLASGTACSKRPATSAEVVAAASPALPQDPGDSRWNRAPEFSGALLLQDLVEPRLMTPSTAQIRVRALTDGTNLAFRLQWVDPTLDDAAAPSRFPDGCAVQLPRDVAGETPAPQMGEPGRPVEITFWRADWQAAVNGRADDIQSLYPNASVDHYPFQAPAAEPGSAAQQAMARRYAPADAAGNRRVGPRKSPVEDLVAQGPGTLTPAGQSRSSGRGIRSRDGWLVVITRPLPAGLASGKRTQVAFAIWEGSHGEAGARKMRTGWVPLLRQSGL